MPGLDGGTYITRSDVLRGQSWALSNADSSRSTRGGVVSSSAVYKPRTLDRAEQRCVKLSTCALTGDALHAPVVCDYLGNLCNKAAVLEWLLASKQSFQDDQAQYRYVNQLRESGATMDHLQSSRDVFTVTLPQATGGGGPGAPTTAPFRCPVTQLPCDKYPFVALVPCGHILSLKAVRQLAADCSCPLCGKPYAPVRSPDSSTGSPITAEQSSTAGPSSTTGSGVQQPCDVESGCQQQPGAATGTSAEKLGKLGNDIIPLVPDDLELQDLRERLQQRKQRSKGKHKRKREADVVKEVADGL